MLYPCPQSAFLIVQQALAPGDSLKNMFSHGAVMGGRVNPILHSPGPEGLFDIAIHVSKIFRKYYPPFSLKQKATILNAFLAFYFSSFLKKKQICGIIRDNVVSIIPPAKQTKQTQMDGVKGAGGPHKRAPPLWRGRSYAAAPEWQSWGSAIDVLPS